jgi:uncharacterized protein YceK
MKKSIFLFVTMLFLMACSSSIKTTTENEEGYVGKIESITYLGKMNTKVTYVVTTKTEVQLVGKVKKLKNGKKCFIVKKSDGHDYLLVEKIGEFEIAR